MRRTALVAWLLSAVVAAACGGSSAGSPSSSPAVSLPATQPARSTPAPSTGAQPLPEPAATWNPVRQPDGSFVVEAVSAPQVGVGVAYRYPIGTHCGITATTFDVGGSFWDPVGDPATFRLAEPEDPGVFALVSATEAVWTSSTGFQVRLVRAGQGPRQVFFCD